LTLNGLIQGDDRESRALRIGQHRDAPDARCAERSVTHRTA